MPAASAVPLLSLVVVLSAAACSSGGAASAPTAAVDASGSASPVPSPDEQSAQEPPTRVVDSGGTVAFESPSGNIACSMGGASAVCEIRDHAFEPPGKPADCELDYGTMIGLEGQGPASFLCHGDTAFSAGGSVLPYGERISNGQVSCTSDESGVACSNAAGTHGFELSRARYRVY